MSEPIEISRHSKLDAKAGAVRLNHLNGLRLACPYGGDECHDEDTEESWRTFFVREVFTRHGSTEESEDHQPIPGTELRGSVNERVEEGGLIAPGPCLVILLECAKHHEFELRFQYRAPDEGVTLEVWENERWPVPKRDD